MKTTTSMRGAGVVGLLAGVATVGTMLALSATASAQEAGGQATVGATATTTTTTTTTPTAPAVVAEPERDREREPRMRVHVRHEHDDDSPDHERFVGRFGVGYFGVSQLPIALAQGTGTGGPAGGTVNAPVIGVRWWLQPNLGIDMGIGLGFSTGSTESASGGTTTTIDKASLFGLGIHGGVPLAFAHGRHYSFLVIPEATLGFTTGTIKGTGGTADQNLSGFKLDLGGRIGAEIHFGFIGIPELSLEGSVGVYLRREAIKWKQDTASASDGTTTFGTNVQSDPWALFVNNISAFYYF